MEVWKFEFSWICKTCAISAEKCFYNSERKLNCSNFLIWKIPLYIIREIVSVHWSLIPIHYYLRSRLKVDLIYYSFHYLWKLSRVSRIWLLRVEENDHQHLQSQFLWMGHRVLEEIWAISEGKQSRNMSK